MNCLITINKEDIIKNSFEEIINDKFLNKLSRCPLCGYEMDTLLEESIYNTCLTVSYSNILFPNFLFFIFDFEDEFKESNNLTNLIDAQNLITNLVKDKIKINILDYYLIGCINYPQLFHFTSFIFNLRHGEENRIGKNYYYNDISDENNIEEINIKNENKIIKYISQYNIYIAIYSNKV